MLLNNILRAMQCHTLYFAVKNLFRPQKWKHRALPGELHTLLTQAQSTRVPSLCAAELMTQGARKEVMPCPLGVLAL